MAAIPERGELDIEVDGRILTLKVTMGAARVAQKRSKKTMGELWLAGKRIDVEAIRELTWVMLQAYHADEFKTLDSTDVVFDWFGGPQAFFDYMEFMELESEKRSAALRAAPGDGASAENPQPAQAGTGRDSKTSQAA